VQLSSSSAADLVPEGCACLHRACCCFDRSCGAPASPTNLCRGTGADGVDILLASYRSRDEMLVQNSLCDEKRAFKAICASDPF
jgi:hypothetical protein